MLLTFAAILFGVVGYAFNRIKIVEQHSLRMRLEAFEIAKHSQAAQVNAQAKIAELQQIVDSKKDLFQYSILYRNMGSLGGQAESIAGQLGDLGRHDIVGFSKAADLEQFKTAIEDRWPERFELVPAGEVSDSDEHSLLFFNRQKFESVDRSTVVFEGQILTGDWSQARHFHRLRDKSNGQVLDVLLNPLNPGDGDDCIKQAAGMRIAALGNSTAMIALVDVALGNEFEAEQRDSVLDELLRDDVWKRIRLDNEFDGNRANPDVEADVHWGSEQGLVFVAGTAKTWKSVCRTVDDNRIRSGEERETDARAVQVILSNQAP